MITFVLVSLFALLGAAAGVITGKVIYEKEGLDPPYRVLSVAMGLAIAVGLALVLSNWLTLVQSIFGGVFGILPAVIVSRRMMHIMMDTDDIEPDDSPRTGEKAGSGAGASRYVDPEETNLSVAGAFSGAIGGSIVAYLAIQQCGLIAGGLLALAGVLLAPFVSLGAFFAAISFVATVCICALKTCVRLHAILMKVGSCISDTITTWRK